MKNLKITVPLVVITLLVIICVGAFLVYALIVGNKPTISTTSSSGQLAFNMSGCQKDKTTASNEPVIYIENNKLFFDQVLNTYCNTTKDNLSLSYTINGQDIEINETFSTGEVVKCSCSFDLSGQINNLDQDFYNVKVIYNNTYTQSKEVLYDQKVEDEEKTDNTPTSEVDCKAQGGTWGTIGIFSDKKACNLPTTDANKECRDNSQCQGECIAENSQSVLGKCNDRKINIGCRFLMANSKAVQMCSD